MYIVYGEIIRCVITKVVDRGIWVRFGFLNLLDIVLDSGFLEVDKYQVTRPGINVYLGHI